MGIKERVINSETICTDGSTKTSSIIAIRVCEKVMLSCCLCVFVFLCVRLFGPEATFSSIIYYYYDFTPIISSRFPVYSHLTSVLESLDSM